MGHIKRPLYGSLVGPIKAFLPNSSILLKFEEVRVSIFWVSFKITTGIIPK
jgi:hypothetical protein